MVSQWKRKKYHSYDCNENIFHIITDPIFKMIVIPGIITVIMLTNLNVLIRDHINKNGLIQIVKQKLKLHTSTKIQMMNYTM